MKIVSIGWLILYKLLVYICCTVTSKHKRYTRN